MRYAYKQYILGALGCLTLAVGYFVADGLLAAFIHWAFPGLTFQQWFVVVFFALAIFLAVCVIIASRSKPHDPQA